MDKIGPVGYVNWIMQLFTFTSLFMIEYKYVKIIMIKSFNGIYWKVVITLKW